MKPLPPGPPSPLESEFEGGVFPEELALILRRRQTLWSGRSKLAAEARRMEAALSEGGAAPVRPDAAHGLAGLALSGGGLRSATFSLGVVEVLCERDHLVRFDYVSAVSGGAYLASSLCAAVELAEASPPGLLRPEGGEERAGFVAALRRAGAGLLPRGLPDGLRLPALLLRGVILNLFSILPFLILLFLLTGVLHPDLGGDHPERAGLAHWYRFTPLAAALFVLAVLLHPLLTARRGRSMGSRVRGERVFGALLLLVGVCAFLETLPLLLRIVLGSGGPTLALLLLCGLLISALPVLALTLGRAAGGRPPGRLAGFVLVLLAPALVAALYLVTALWLPLLGVSGRWHLLLLALAVFVLSRVFVDVNRTSMHGYYRDLLSRAFLMGPVAAGGSASPEAADTLGVEDLRPEARGEPFLILNATLNLPAARNPEFASRRGDVFVFTPLASGSEATGYGSTAELAAVDRHLNLGTAMAISGAAAAPHTGAGGSPAFAFLMALLNLRLGYWLPNPGRLQDLRRPWCKTSYRVGPAWFLAELLGLIGEESPRVNLSDGAHLDNLGLQALLRRRCRRILVCDASHDPQRSFSDLARACTFARVDLGIRFTWEGLAEMQRGESGALHARARILYPGGGEGTLVYLRPMLHAGVDPDVRAYAAEHPSFPHEATADLAYDELQFEAYRRLGRSCAEALLHGRPAGEQGFLDLFGETVSRKPAAVRARKSGTTRKSPAGRGTARKQRATKKAGGKPGAKTRRSR